MDYTSILSLVVEIVSYAYPIALIFGLASKLINLSLDMILNRKINL